MVILKHRSKSRREECQICKKRYFQKRDLRRHIRHVHNKVPRKDNRNKNNQTKTKENTENQ